ncbi:hypothetical protein DSO57_1000649 [Entomophthora muscae]|uniref:Uncharacterized protein n=1 Tax=Entomophthora muscae TaxID=34485 RepID=A0ACC2TW74_9FUNG|nr:hypothetical protein DSO57_1000649 [Entomophthora muscae]
MFDPRYDWVTIETVPYSPTERGYTLNNVKLLDNFSNFNAQDEARMSIDNSASGSPMVARDPKSPLMSQFDNSPMDVKPLIPCDPDKFNAKPKGGNYFVGGTGTTLPHLNNWGEAEVAQEVVNPPMDTFLTPREWYNPFWMAAHSAEANDLKQGHSKVKQEIPKLPIIKQNLSTKKPMITSGISAERILKKMMMSISLEDLCRESPKF